jgi:hypothetical protein
MSITFKHGYGGYVTHRCRCVICKEANFKYHKEYCATPIYKEKKAKYWASATGKEIMKRSSLKRKLTPKGRFVTYKWGARNRGIAFELTFEQFVAFWQKPCHYCGGEIDTIGLDRIDSAKGYIVDNVVPCCSTHNLMKNDMTHDQFVNACRIVVKHLSGEIK